MNSPAKKKPGANPQTYVDMDFPPLSDFFSPRRQLRWLWRFIEAWFYSRRYTLLPAVLPMIVVLVAGGIFLWKVRGMGSQQQVVDNFRSAAAEAEAEGELERAVFYRSRLTLPQYRPTDYENRLKYVTHLVELGRVDEAKPHIKLLTSPVVNDLRSQAWLIQQAISDKPAIKLTEQEIEVHCLLALQRASDNVPIRRILAEQYLKRGQLKSAEEHINLLLSSTPELGVQQARIQQRLGRDPEIIQGNLSRAAEKLTVMLRENPFNVETRRQLATAQMELKKPRLAEEILREGLQRDPSSVELRKSLANFYSTVAAARYASSSLNLNYSADLAAQALQLDPGNPGTIQQALALESLGARYKPEQLEPSIAALRLAPEDEDDTARLNRQILLARALTAAGQLQEGIDLVASLADTQPDLQLVHARMLERAGQTEKSQQILARLLETFPTDDPLSALKRAETLLLLGRAEESRALLSTIEAELQENEEPAAPETEEARIRTVLQRLKARTLLAIYDTRLKANSFERPEEAIELLTEIINTNAENVNVLSRLASLAFDDSPLSKPANKILTRLLATGANNADIYNFVGSRALEVGKNREALTFLNRAYELNRSNPMVLNNLALALARDEGGSRERALQLCKDALGILPNHPDVLSTRAEVFVAKEQWEEALRDLEISLRHRPKSTNIRRLLVKVCTALNDPDLAEEHQRILAELEAS